MNVDLNRVQHMLSWLHEKIKLDAHATQARRRVVYRGQVYRCNFGYGIGDEMRKDRPAVIIQNNTGNSNAGTVIVAPVTHTQKDLPTVVCLQPVMDDEGNVILEGYVNTSHIMAFSKARLGDRICNLPRSEIQRIDKAIANALHLTHYVKERDDIIKELNNKINDLDEKICALESKIEEQKTNEEKTEEQDD